MISLIGTAAATLSTVAFLPQAIYVLRTRDTRSLSLPMYVMFFISVVLWCLYGILIGDLPLSISNAIVVVLAFLIMAFKIKNYQSDRKAQRKQANK